MIDIIALRRDLHQHPELGFTEFRTATKVVHMLTELGYQVTYGKNAIDDTSRRGLPKPEVLDDAYQRAIREGADPAIVQQMRGGFTAVVAELEGLQEGPTTAFRFDMDALPIRESGLDKHAPTAGQFRSTHEGLMHACAHDGHTAIGLALAERLSDRQFAGKVRLLFQPAEEGVRGAYAMVEKGCWNRWIVCSACTSVPAYPQVMSEGRLPDSWQRLNWKPALQVYPPMRALHRRKDVMRCLVRLRRC